MNQVTSYANICVWRLFSQICGQTVGAAVLGSGTDGSPWFLIVKIYGFYKRYQRNEYRTESRMKDIANYTKNFDYTWPDVKICDASRVLTENTNLDHLYCYKD